MTKKVNKQLSTQQAFNRTKTEAKRLHKEFNWNRISFDALLRERGWNSKPGPWKATLKDVDGEYTEDNILVGTEVDIRNAASEITRPCRKCKEVKPGTEFDDDNRPVPECKECVAADEMKAAKIKAERARKAKIKADKIKAEMARKDKERDRKNKELNEAFKKHQAKLSNNISLDVDSGLDPTVVRLEDGEIVEVYPNAHAAAKKYNINYNAIIKRLKSDKHRYMYYDWWYKRDLKDFDNIKHSKIKFNVYKIDPDNVTILGSYLDELHAARSNGIPYDLIDYCLATDTYDNDIEGVLEVSDWIWRYQDMYVGK